MAGAFDATLKQLLDTCAPDWVAWLAPLVGLPATVGAVALDVELSTVQPAADKVFRLSGPGQGLLHLEPQSSWDGEFANRLLLYNVLMEERYGGPVHTVALLLRHEASAGGLTGTVVRRTWHGDEYLRFVYTIVRVWELEADVLLNGGLGATPLALLTDDAEPRLARVVDRFAERVVREAPTPTDASLLLSCGFILMGLRYDRAVARSLFQGAQRMKESSTYQAILDEGRDEGRNEGLARGRIEGRTEGRIEGLISARQEDVLALLQERFGTVPPEVEARVRATTDESVLQTALRRVLHITAPDQLPL
jgi:predicted transposase YdaD